MIAKMLISTSQLTGNDPARMAESAAINKSLSVLGQVVHALNQGAVSYFFLPTSFLFLKLASSLEYRTEIRSLPGYYKMHLVARPLAFLFVILRQVPSLDKTPLIP
jgi:hypothetical protein